MTVRFSGQQQHEHQQHQQHRGEDPQRFAALLDDSPDDHGREVTDRPGGLAGFPDGESDLSRVNELIQEHQAGDDPHGGGNNAHLE